MTRRSLKPSQRQTVEIIEQLGFGRIEQLLIHNGEPCYDRAPKVTEEIRLASEPEPQSDLGNADLTLKKEFANLFVHLERLRDGIVDIEVRHSVAFRLVMERRYADLLSSRRSK